MFKNTMAVGPFDPAEFCVTGGVCTVARHLAAWAALLGRRSDDADEAGRDKLFESLVADCRSAMATMSVGNIMEEYRIGATRIKHSRISLVQGEKKPSRLGDVSLRRRISRSSSRPRSLPIPACHRIGQQLMTGCQHRAPLWRRPACTYRCYRCYRELLQPDLAPAAVDRELHLEGLDFLHRVSAYKTRLSYTDAGGCLEGESAVNCRLNAQPNLSHQANDFSLSSPLRNRAIQSSDSLQEQPKWHTTDKTTSALKRTTVTRRLARM